MKLYGPKRFRRAHFHKRRWIGTALSPVTASASVTLDALTLNGAAAVAVTGSLGVTLDALTLTGSAAVAVTATTDVTLEALTLSGAAAVTNGPAGSLGVTLDDLTLNGTAEVTGRGTVGGGRPATTRRHVLQFKGKAYVLAREDDADAVLRQLIEDERQEVRRVVKRAKTAAKTSQPVPQVSEPPRVEANYPEVGGASLYYEIEVANDAIARIYAQAYAEVARLQLAEMDDEEVLLLL